MKKIYLGYTIIVLAFSSCVSPYQSGLKNYEKLAYYKAINNFKQAIKQNENNQDAHLKLAESYRKINSPKLAEPHFKKAFEINEDVEPLYFLNYANVLKNVEKYEWAKVWYAKYLKFNPTDERALQLLNSCNSFTDNNNSNDSYVYTITPLNLSQDASHFSPTYYQDRVVFSSELNLDNKNKINPWNKRAYLDLYSIKKQDYYDKLEPKAFDNAINSQFHEGPAAFSEDQKTIYFTRSNFDRKKPGKSISNENNLKIYQGKSTGKDWNDIKALPFNSDEYSCGHPTLSLDGKTLYFISDMPGGLGGTDIYKSVFNNGKWEAPLNIGKPINTEGNEMFPRIIKNDEGEEVLYFSSDGHSGVGGLDVFKYILSNASSKIEHLPFPINGYKDDFGVLPNPGETDGLICSNRDNDFGIDRIYTYKQKYLVLAIRGMVLNKKTQAPLDSAYVVITNKLISDTLWTNEEGTFFKPIKLNKNYSIFVNHPEYFAYKKDFSTIGITESDTIELTVELEPIEIDKPIVLENIFYDFDKWNIRKDAEPGLDYLIKVLNDNPEIVIELSSHTDSRGSNAYNQVLSEKRAQSAVDYIISKGQISSNRITAKGYGESQLINECKDGVYCTEKEHQENRRTEFKVVKLIDF